jgi:hypothetical protein
MKSITSTAKDLYVKCKMAPNLQQNEKVKLHQLTRRYYLRWSLTSLRQRLHINNKTPYTEVTRSFRLSEFAAAQIRRQLNKFAYFSIISLRFADAAASDGNTCVSVAVSLDDRQEPFKPGWSELDLTAILRHSNRRPRCHIDIRANQNELH